MNENNLVSTIANTVKFYADCVELFSDFGSVVKALIGFKGVLL